MATIVFKKWGILVAVVMMQVSMGMSDIEKDKEECANQLVGLATCLPYVGGQSKAPTPDCCTGLNQVLKDSKKCLCVLVRDRNDPSLGLNINSTLALSLPHSCHAPPKLANVSDCLALLHLAPNSPEAKVFSDFDNAKAATNSTSAPAASETSNKGSGTTAKATSNAAGKKGNRARSMVTQIIYGPFFLFFASLFIF